MRNASEVNTRTPSTLIFAELICALPPSVPSVVLELDRPQLAKTVTHCCSSTAPLAPAAAGGVPQEPGAHHDSPFLQCQSVPGINHLLLMQRDQSHAYVLKADRHFPWHSVTRL